MAILTDISDISANASRIDIPPDAKYVTARKHMLKKAAAAAAAKKAKELQHLHSRNEAKQLVKDAEMHTWLMKRQKKGAEAKPRMYFTKFRRETLEKCFTSIDRDGSGSIDKGELVFALTQLGLDKSHAASILAEGDRDENGDISLPEFFALVATVSAREAQGGVRKGGASSDAPALKLTPSEERERAAAASKEAAAHSLRDLVDRAANFPIGLLANAQHVSRLVGNFDPEGYASRCTLEEAERPWWREQSSHHLDDESAAAARALPALALGKDGHLRLPRLTALSSSGHLGGAAGSSADSARGSSGGGSARAASAPLKSTKHSRWLQRGLTYKDTAQVAQTARPAVGKPKGLQASARLATHALRATSAGSAKSAGSATSASSATSAGGSSTTSEATTTRSAREQQHQHAEEERRGAAIAREVVVRPQRARSTSLPGIV